MRGFVFIVAGLALIYVALTGKVGDLAVAVLTGQSSTSGKATIG